MVGMFSTVCVLLVVLFDCGREGRVGRKEDITDVTRSYCEYEHMSYDMYCAYGYVLCSYVFLQVPIYYDI